MGCKGKSASEYIIHPAELIKFVKELSEYFHFFWQVRTFRGHTNEKNFVGLTVNNEYIACGSETNEVFIYHKVSYIQSRGLPFFILKLT